VLVDNEVIAHKRLSSLQRKLDKDPALKAGYSDVFQELERGGIIEEVGDIQCFTCPIIR
jgi:hypothetical protein